MFRLCEKDLENLSYCEDELGYLTSIINMLRFGSSDFFFNMLNRTAMDKNKEKKFFKEFKELFENIRNKNN